MIFLFYPCIFNKQGKQTNKNSQTQTTAWWLPEGRGWEAVRVSGVECMVTDEDWLWVVGTQYNI